MKSDSLVSEQPILLTQAKNQKIPVKYKYQNSFIKWFLLCILFLTICSLFYLNVDWLRLISRVPDIGTVFWKLGHFQFDKIDLILQTMLQTISIAVLSLLYSIVLGLFFSIFAAQNILKIKWLSKVTQAFFTFLRAVPTPIWVLLMLVCLGMGPAAGVAGLCVHTTAFFTKSFAQSFESISDETLEALEVTGAGRLTIFFQAMLPSVLSQLVAWAGMRLEVNFSECTILGMIGAGGIGFVISSSLQGYDYGTAGVAILLVFVLAYFIERCFIKLKELFR